MIWSKEYIGDIKMYFDRHFSLITGYRFLLKDVIKYIATIDSFFDSKYKILDIGCGKKPYKKLLKKSDYVGLDVCECEYANPDIIGSSENIPCKNDNFDAIMTVFVLDDSFYIKKTFYKISRVLKDGGYYFALEAQNTSIHNSPFDFFRFAPNAMIKLAKEVNLELIRYDTYGGDFANVGFCFISIIRNTLSSLRMEPFLGPIFYLPINVIFRLLDLIGRLKVFRNKYKNNSLGYFYVFKKVENA